MAVLDVIEQENLLEICRQVGEYIRAGLRELMGKHDIIGDVRGHGLFNGVELVKDRKSKEGAAEETNRVVNQLKERGILLSKIGTQNNILKMRPPLPFSVDNADYLLSAIDNVLCEL